MQITGLPVPLDLTGDVERLVADSSPGWPCRRCLHDAEVGKVVLLVSSDPRRSPSDRPDNPECITCDGYENRDKDILVVEHTDPAAGQALQLHSLTTTVRLLTNSHANDISEKYQGCGGAPALM